MKTILIFLSILSISSAQLCWFDSTFNRPICENSTLTSQNSTVWTMDYLKTKITPDIWNQRAISGLTAILNGTLKSNLTINETIKIYKDLTKQEQLPTIYQPNNSTSLVALASNVSKVKPCATKRDKDWEVFCKNNMLGSDCFCVGCDKKPLVYAAWNATKNMVMANMEAVKGCKYVK